VMQSSNNTKHTLLAVFFRLASKSRKFKYFDYTLTPSK
jgi:hypothetical protein